MQGIIVKGIGGFYYIKTPDGARYECSARGILRRRKITPMIGDKALIEVKNGKGTIVDIMPRKNSMTRPPVANIDTLVIVSAAASPEPDLGLIDKMLISAQKADITPIVCINKTDLSRKDEIVSAYSAAGYRVIETSAYESRGIDELKEAVRDHISAFCGLSGVGKSSLMNRVLERDYMETGSVSDKIQRGRHTTRHVELVDLPYGGMVLDTPGFSSLEIETDIDARDLWEYFPEIAVYNGQCRFRGCAHVSEPDCAVKTAVENGEIAKIRYESYVSMYNILKDIKAWQK